MGAYFIGVDAGSSLCKAAVFDDTGRQYGEAALRTPISRVHPGWSELDPDMCWHACATVIREAVRKSGINADEIKGLGISAAMVGAWFLDPAGQALRPGIIWEDCRSQSLLDRLEARTPGFYDTIFQHSGCALQQGCTLPVVAWFAENAPGFLSRVHSIVGYKDYLRAKITGKIATDQSEAAVAPGDTRTQSRSEEMIDLFGLRAWRGAFPDPQPSTAQAGGLTAAAAEMLGLRAGLPVSIGAGDVPSTVTGAGGAIPERITAVLGTTLMVGVCRDHPVFSPPGVGLLFPLPGGYWYRAMVNVAGTLNLDWAFQALAPDMEADAQRFDKITHAASEIAPGAEGLTYLPYLSESGIIAPVVNAAARAGFEGLSPVHRRAHMFRAVFEGVAFAFADLLSGIDAREREPVYLTGGGSRSAFWRQMIADVTGRDIVTPGGVQFGARGAAMIAMTAAGHFTSVAAATTALREETSVTRPVADASQYAPARERFLAARKRALGV